MASMTILAFPGFLSLTISAKSRGTICHDSPYLSLSQPHWFGSPPADNVSHFSSISCWVSQFTTNDTASVNLNVGPPFNATNPRPASFRGNSLSAQQRENALGGDGKLSATACPLASALWI